MDTGEALRVLDLVPGDGEDDVVRAYRTPSGLDVPDRQLNRGSDRRANSALWHIVITRMVCDPCITTEYIDRRRKDSLTKKASVRCLKRYVARKVYTSCLTKEHRTGAPQLLPAAEHILEPRVHGQGVTTVPAGLSDAGLR